MLLTKRCTLPATQKYSRPPLSIKPCPVGPVRQQQQQQQQYRQAGNRGSSNVSAGASGKENDPVLRYAQSIGLPTEEGVLGFKPFSEVSEAVGRACIDEGIMRLRMRLGNS